MLGEDRNISEVGEAAEANCWGIQPGCDPVHQVQSYQWWRGLQKLAVWRQTLQPLRCTLENRRCHQGELSWCRQPPLHPSFPGTWPRPLEQSWAGANLLLQFPALTR